MRHPFRKTSDVPFQPGTEGRTNRSPFNGSSVPTGAGVSHLEAPGSFCVSLWAFTSLGNEWTPPLLRPSTAPTPAAPVAPSPGRDRLHSRRQSVKPRPEDPEWYAVDMCTRVHGFSLSSGIPLIFDFVRVRWGRGRSDPEP